MNSSGMIEAVSAKFADGVLASHVFRGDATVVVRRESLFDVARFVKDDPALSMNFLMDLSAVDYSTFGKGPTPAFFASSGVAVKPSTQIPDEDPWPGPGYVSEKRGADPEEWRFTVVYHFYSTTHKHRLRLVVPLTEDDAEVDTVTSLWAGANWLEREAWDMFGIVFRGHPDPRRILLYAEFEGHPLRKDYPVNKRQPLIGPLN